MDHRVSFGIAAAASDAEGMGDHELYRTLIGDCEQAAELGFTNIWFFEHHFSDYYPTPSPIVLMSNVAARLPELELGTCVLVLPWYQPLRLAEDVAMLSSLTERPLHFGLGRGTAQSEYDRFGIAMGESRDRFDETFEIVRRSLAGTGPFTYQGRHTTVDAPVEVRPRVPRERRDTVHFYGSVSSAASAQRIGEVGLRPLAATNSDLGAQQAILAAWETAAAAAGHPTDVMRPILAKCIVAETDEDAVAQAKRYFPRYFRVQLEHYRPDDLDWSKLDSYRDFRGVFASWERLATDPSAIAAWAHFQLVGSPDTVIRQVRALADAGFDHVVLQPATPGIPHDVRRRWTQLFAEQVAPAFQPVDANAGELDRR